MTQLRGRGPGDAHGHDHGDGHRHGLEPARGLLLNLVLLVGREQSFFACPKALSKKSRSPDRTVHVLNLVPVLPLHQYLALGTICTNTIDFRGFLFSMTVFNKFSTTRTRVHT
jgi:hypothetical protein